MFDTMINMQRFRLIRSCFILRISKTYNTESIYLYVGCTNMKKLQLNFAQQTKDTTKKKCWILND